jgi:hypothetical protein
VFEPEAKAPKEEESAVEEIKESDGTVVSLGQGLPEIDTTSIEAVDWSVVEGQLPAVVKYNPVLKIMFKKQFEKMKNNPAQFK